MISEAVKKAQKPPPKVDEQDDTKPADEQGDQEQGEEEHGEEDVEVEALGKNEREVDQ